MAMVWRLCNESGKGGCGSATAAGWLASSARVASERFHLLGLNTLDRVEQPRRPCRSKTHEAGDGEKENDSEERYREGFQWGDGEVAVVVATDRATAQKCYARRTAADERTYESGDAVAGGAAPLGERSMGLAGGRHPNPPHHPRQTWAMASRFPAKCPTACI